jgi:hypothetical protein
METKNMTLSEVLTQLGYSHTKGINYQRSIFKGNKYIGNMRAGECWKWLRKTKQINE